MRIGDEGKFEISAASLVMLGVATLAASGAAFLFGFYVGKGVVEERYEQAQKPVRVPVTPSAGGGEGDVEVTFWDRLGKGEAGGTPGTAEPTPTEAPIRVVPPAVETAPPPPPVHAPAATVMAPPVAEVGAYQVQVTAVADRGRADAMVRELEGRGYRAQIVAGKTGTKTVYKIRVGRFASDTEARQVLTRLREQGYAGAFLVAE